MSTSLSESVAGRPGFALQFGMVFLPPIVFEELTSDGGETRGCYGFVLRFHREVPGQAEQFIRLSGEAAIRLSALHPTPQML